ncbi:MAG: hypothetical protein WBY53_04755 [Acidobacteriaceae bacterium]
MRRAPFALLGILVIACIVFAAMPHLAAPDWTVTVIDPTGRPMTGTRVHEVYRNFHCDSSDHESTASTNDLGVVHFPAQYEHRNPLECIMVTISNAQAPAHASSASIASVFAFGPGGEASPTDAHGNTQQWTGSPPRIKSQIMIKY